MKARLPSRPGKKVEVVDDENGGLIIGETHNLQQSLRAAELTNQAGGYTSDTMRQQAIIPPDVLAKSMREGWTEADWRKWANDPANRPFRVEHNGKIQRI